MLLRDLVPPVQLIPTTRNHRIPNQLLANPDQHLILLLLLPMLLPLRTTSPLIKTKDRDREDKAENLSTILLLLR
jgi:hypothetical protein